MKKRSHKIILGLLIAILILGGFFYSYVSDYYKADASVDSLLMHQFVETEDLYYATADQPTDKALIFYPGGKVQAKAYLPLLDQMASKGITVVLVKMPFNLAFFDSKAADRIYGQFPEIKHWYIGGHSLGGAMASQYASDHQDQIEKLVLLGAYVYGDFPKERAITIYGENDQVLSREKVDYDTNVHIIKGGNHGQFGNYGFQAGDGQASITHEEQQAETVQLILDFLNEK